MTVDQRSNITIAVYFIAASTLIGGWLFGHALLGFFVAIGVIWYLVRPQHVIQKAFDIVAENPLGWAGRIFLAGIVGGGTIFSILESSANIFDGMWWAFVSMTTVGYGDISPSTPEMRIVAICLIAMGMAVTAIIIGEIAAGINDVRARRRHEVASETAELDDDIDSIVQYLNLSMEELKSRLQHPHVVGALKRCHEEQLAAGRRKA